jgi:hypothetical protein
MSSNVKARFSVLPVGETGHFSSAVLREETDLGDQAHRRVRGRAYSP